MVAVTATLAGETAASAAATVAEIVAETAAVSADLTALPPPTHQTALVGMAAVMAAAMTDEAALLTAVGMAVMAAVVAHMTIDLAAEASAAIATCGNPAATWSPSDLAASGRMVGITATAVVETMATATAEAEAAETMTDPGIRTTLANAVSKAATRILGNSDATNKSTPRRCLVVGIHPSVLSLPPSLASSSL